jgi:hypothetical protein
MIGFMNVLKQEGAKYNVMVNTIAPVAGTRLTQTVMPQEMVDRLKPEYVVPAVTYLVSNENTDSGLIIEAGAGSFNRAVMVKGPGVRPGLEELKDAEWVQANWGPITSLEGAVPMWNPQTPLSKWEEEKAKG